MNIFLMRLKSSTPSLTKAQAFPSKAGQLVLHKTDKQTVAGEKHLLGGRNNMRLSPLDNSNHHFRDTVPETIEHLNPHYQHCALCRTPRVCWNKKWSDTIITVLHNIYDQYSPFTVTQSVLSAKYSHHLKQQSFPVLLSTSMINTVNYTSSPTHCHTSITHNVAIFPCSCGIETEDWKRVCGGAKFFGSALITTASAQCLRITDRFFSETVLGFGWMFQNSFVCRHDISIPFNFGSLESY